MSEARRRNLARTVKLMTAIALVAIAVILYQSVTDKPAEPKAVPVVRYGLDALPVGASTVLLWGGRPVLITHRSPAEVERLDSLNAALADPASTRSQQPPSMCNPIRALRPEWFVAIARGTGAGCPLKPVAALARVNVSPWAGGYRDSCDGALYDPAGRVYRDQPAATNLVVPPYHFEPGGQLLIGTEE